MLILNSLEYTFNSAFGGSRTGKTVVVTILDNVGANKATGFTMGSVIELGEGYYGVTISFSDNFNGWIKWNNTTDSLVLYEPIVVVADYRVNITTVKKILCNRWKITGGQLIEYNDDGTTPMNTYDLKKGGLANDGSDPDERIPV